MRVLISSITVPRERQRQDLGDVSSLAESLARTGLINPVILVKHKDGYLLVAGERRLTAAKSLGWTDIEARLWEDNRISTRRVLEFEENAKRKDLTWQEEIRAIEAYHKMMLSGNPTWSYEDTSRELSIAVTGIAKRMAVAAKLDSMPELMECASWNAAYNIVQRANERALDAGIDLIFGEYGPTESPPADTIPAESSAEPPAPSPEGEPSSPTVLSFPAPAKVEAPPERVIQADFHEWAASYSGPPFNFIHCDFPYGVGMGVNQLQGTRRDLARYEDGEDTYWDLFHTLFIEHRKKLISSSAHVMFWLSPNMLVDTMENLRNLAADIRVDPWPLIWHKSDNRGILPDPQRGPRHTYEIALHISFGDRKIVRPIAASVSSPLNKAEAQHLSEKPQEVLRHFFRLYVDGSTRMLDPTCGSGNALAVAEMLGAESVFGLDLASVENARKVLADATRGRRTGTTLDLDILEECGK